MSSPSTIAPSVKRDVETTGAQTFDVLDVEALNANDPLKSGISHFVLSCRPKVIRCDVFIAGGGMGGIAAAIRAAQLGMHVCLTEETSWLGGQMTAQGVSALDENYMVETTGATRLYQSLRESIRQYYRSYPGASQDTAEDEALNPGNCWVTYLSFEPQVALAKLQDLINSTIPKNHLTTHLRTKVVSLKVNRGRIRSLLTVNLDSGQFTEFRPKFVIDATELGDLLPMADVPYSSGAESQAQTGEPHAPAVANPENVQDFVYPFVIEYRPGTSNLIAKPPEYDQFLARGKFSFNGYKMFEPAPAGNDGEFLPFWTYRRLIAKENFPASSFHFDVAMINWDSNDLRGENIIDQPLDAQAKRLALAKNLSLGFLYWLQTEAPRDDGGKGYPELCLRTDTLGTTDGLSKYPYIRESRRIKAVETIVEQDVAAANNPAARARLFDDSVGIGLYPIDIHGHQDVPGAGQASKPFQIPLGSLVQTKVRNLIPACKNIGTTHVTNGAYRLHPVEWAIGEAAGTMAAYSERWRSCPEKLLANRMKVRTIQNTLVREGTPVFWYNDVLTTDPDFAAIQYVSVANIMRASDADLSFGPNETITRGDAALVFARLCEHVHRKRQQQAEAKELATVADCNAPNLQSAIDCCRALGIMRACADGEFHAEQPLNLDDIDQKALMHLFHRELEAEGNTPTRGEFATWAYRVGSSKRLMGLI